MNAEQALHKFWSSFNLVAYDENTVPDDAQLPYITYEASKDFFGATLAQSVSLWYYSQSWAAITEKAEEIAQDIGKGGRMVAYDGGAFWIKRGQPWAQRQPDASDDMVRRIVLNIEIEFVEE